MLSTGIVLFREVLEMALILSIILVATRGVVGRGRWVVFGLLAGLAGSAIVALFAEGISNAFEGSGQELFNAGILFAASAMIVWTVVWMKNHAREMAQHLKHVGHAVQAGTMPLYSIAVVIALAMLREGSEIVLFMAGILTASEEPLSMIITGGVLGAVAAAVIGLLLYSGLVHIHAKYFFRVTSILLTLLAAGLSAQGAGFLIAGGVLDEWMPGLWDTSNILSQESAIGMVLHSLIGYIAEPSGTQLVFYAATIGLITVLMKKTSAVVPVQAKAA